MRHFSPLTYYEAFFASDVRTSMRTTFSQVTFPPYEEIPIIVYLLQGKMPILWGIFPCCEAFSSQVRSFPYEEIPILAYLL